jgi:hypothetical protein
LGTPGKLFKAPPAKPGPAPLQRLGRMVDITDLARACQLRPWAAQWDEPEILCRWVVCCLLVLSFVVPFPPIRPRPRTCADWIECVSLLAPAIACSFLGSRSAPPKPAGGAGVPAVPKVLGTYGYCVQWLARMFLMSRPQSVSSACTRERWPGRVGTSCISGLGRSGIKTNNPARLSGVMRVQGIPSLALGSEGADMVQQAEDVERFAAAFPDRHGWLCQLATFFSAWRVGSLRCALRHPRGCPELLSMECCLYMVCPAQSWTTWAT